MVKDYTQLPQKPIRLKPRIANEKPSGTTRSGPPAEILRENVTMKQRRPVKKKSRSAADQWTLRGVSPETREAVALAAREDGMTIGAWVDEVLQEVLSADPFETAHAETNQEIMERLEDIRARLETLEERKNLWEQLKAYWS